MVGDQKSLIDIAYYGSGAQVDPCLARNAPSHGNQGGHVIGKGGYIAVRVPTDLDRGANTPFQMPKFRVADVPYGPRFFGGIKILAQALRMGRILPVIGAFGEGIGASAI